MRVPLVVALLVPLAAWADGMPELPPPNDVPEFWPLGGKSEEQVHSSILVYSQPFRVALPAKARTEESKKAAAGAAFSVSMSDTGGGSSRGSGGARSPQRTSPRQPFSSNNDAPTYGGPSDVRAATMSSDSHSTNPCSRDGYHDNVMSHGLDTARTKCELHQLDKNRWQLWALSGGDPLLHHAMDKQLDKGLDLFNVPK